MRRAGLVLVVGLLMTACGGGPDEVTGSVSIFKGQTADRFDEDNYFAGRDGECIGRKGYDDLSQGTQVTVYDEGGDIVGTGELGAGKEVGGVRCELPFRVTDLKDAEFYQFEVSRRGKITKQPDELEEGVYLSIGD